MFIKVNDCTVLVYDYARPSTPIHEVLEFKYQDEWLERQRRLHAAKVKKMQAKVCAVIFKSFCRNL